MLYSVPSVERTFSGDFKTTISVNETVLNNKLNQFTFLSNQTLLVFCYFQGSEIFTCQCQENKVKGDSLQKK